MVLIVLMFIVLWVICCVLPGYGWGLVLGVGFGFVVLRCGFCLPFGDVLCRLRVRLPVCRLVWACDIALFGFWILVWVCL